MKMLESASGKTPGSDGQHRNDIEARAYETLGNFDENERRGILDRLREMTRDRLVPTLGIFFTNVHYLEEVLKCFQHLFGPGFKKDFRRNFAMAFRQQRDCEAQNLRILQVSDNRYKTVVCTEIDAIELAYRQLWLFALREFPSMPWQPERQKAAAIYHVEEVTLYRFAAFAKKLGISTPQITKIVERPIAMPPPAKDNSTVTDGHDHSQYSGGKPGFQEQKTYKGSLFLANLHKPFDANHRDSRFHFSQQSLYFDIFGNKFQGINDLLRASIGTAELDIIDDTHQRANEDLLKNKKTLVEELRSLEVNIKLTKQESSHREQEFRNLVNAVKEKEEELELSIEEKQKEADKQENRLDALKSQVRQDEENHNKSLRERKETLDKLEQEKKTLDADVQRLRSRVEELVSTSR
jgi:hypothetical protein